MAVALVFKDRHLPTNCEECFLCNDHFFGFYKCRYAELWGTRKRRADDCPLIEMPTQEDGTQFKGTD